MTRAPPCAMSVAIAAATVDLPSLGKQEVTPITLVLSLLLFRSTVNFIDRMASAYGEDGELMMVRMPVWSEANALRPSLNSKLLRSLLAPEQGVADEKTVLCGESVSNGTTARHSVERTDSYLFPGPESAVHHFP